MEEQNNEISMHRDQNNSEQTDNLQLVNSQSIHHGAR